MPVLDTVTTIKSIVESVGGLLGSLIAIIGTLSVVIKPARDWIVKKLSTRQDMVDMQAQLNRLEELIRKVDADNVSQKDEIELVKQSEMCLCRSRLTALYYEAKDAGGISDYNRENFEKLYEAYTKLGGNSYVHEIRDEIIKMDRIS